MQNSDSILTQGSNFISGLTHKSISDEKENMEFCSSKLSRKYNTRIHINHSRISIFSIGHDSAVRDRKREMIYVTTVTSGQMISLRHKIAIPSLYLISANVESYERNIYLHSFHRNKKQFQLRNIIQFYILSSKMSCRILNFIVESWLLFIWEMNPLN